MADFMFDVLCVKRSLRFAATRQSAVATFVLCDRPTDGLVTEANF